MPNHSRCAAFSNTQCSTGDSSLCNVNPYCYVMHEVYEQVWSTWYVNVIENLMKSELFHT